MTKVLITLDYNPSAQKVAEEGFSFAKSMSAEVTLLHVISDPAFYSSVEYSPIMGFEGYKDSVQAQLDNIHALKKESLDYLDKVKQHLGDTTLKTTVKEGNPSKAILSAAKDLHADFIVMGSHSQKWLQNIALGSVTENVARKTNVPLLIIPTKKHN
jgi:nucleotide-binding universal stress UspA family protein